VVVVLAGVCVVVVLEAGCSVVVVLVAGAEAAGTTVVWEQADSAARATLARHGRMNFFIGRVVVWIVLPPYSSATRRLVPGRARAKSFAAN
jgi:hypothetical protein